MSNSARALIGAPENFKGLFKIYPPKVMDVVGNDKFGRYLSIFTTSQEDIEDQLFDREAKITIKEGEIPTPYEYLIALMLSNQEYCELVKEAFFFFTHEELNFIPERQLLLIGNLEEIIMNLDNLEELPIFKPEDYFEFQNAVRTSLGQEPIEPYDYNIHPKARIFKAKARYRDKIKSKRANGNDGTGTQTITNNLASICCMGIGITPLNIGEMSYAAVSILITKYQLKEKYDIDIRSLLAGASSKKVKPKYWMQDNKEN